MISLRQLGELGSFLSPSEESMMCLLPCHLAGETNLSSILCSYPSLCWCSSCQVRAMDAAVSWQLCWLGTVKAAWSLHTHGSPLLCQYFKAGSGTILLSVLGQIMSTTCQSSGPPLLLWFIQGTTSLWLTIEFLWSTCPNILLSHFT